MTFEAFGHMTNGICLVGISCATRVIPNTTHVIPDLIRNPLFLFVGLKNGPRVKPGVTLVGRGDVGWPG